MLEGFAILRVVVESKIQGQVKLGIRLKVADDSSKNVNLPETELLEKMFTRDPKSAFCFVKIDPSKEGWGNLSLELNVKQVKPSAYGNSDISVTGTAVGPSRSVSVGVGGSSTPPSNSSYKPIGYGDEVKLACPHCQAMVDVGQTFCHACGESTE